jgi:tRNA(Ile)-lysidine synthase
MSILSNAEKLLLKKSSKVVVGLSGGADSTLALVETYEFLKAENLTEKLVALHINHHLHEDSEHWEQHCVNLCAKLSVKYDVKKINPQQSGEGLEAAMRSERLKIFNSYEKGTVIVQGHHASDQVETLLFRLIRGTGIKGVSGIKRIRPAGEITFIRPLIKLTKKEVLEHLKVRKIQFIKDPSNEDNQFSRNYLRNVVIPHITRRWNTVEKNISRFTALAQKQNTLYEKMLKERLIDLVDGNALDLEKMESLSSFEKSELIRMWLENLSMFLPNEKQMEEIEKSFFQSRHDANPVVKFRRDDIKEFSIVLSKQNKFLIAEKNYE